ncbi:hypothetical protein AOPFMNJM_3282 [Methylobacterium jeotgali]|uniref:Uncharacterized protein n=1 Tax=Methylobacterium jeotgali TaxID=381630 RepID=A0ABQ4SXL6_9HYPH|nr:hypothetical protein AOPFMNJM_3282 [Methylobacterium jeotgali]
MEGRRRLQRHGADGDAEAEGKLLGDARQARARAHVAGLEIGVGDGVDAGELQRAQAAAEEQHPDDEGVRGRSRIETVHAEEGGGQQRVRHHHPSEAVAPQDRRPDRLHEERAGCRREGDQPRVQRVEAEADLQHQRQQEGDRPGADPEQAAARHRRPEGRVAQKVEVKDRVRGRAGMAKVEREKSRAAAEAAPGQPVRQQVAADGGEPEHQPPEPAGEQQEARHVEGRALRLADVLEIQARKQQPGKPDRDVDQEDPAPVEPSGDQAPQRRPQDRPDQGGDRQVGERRDELGLRNAAQDDEAPDRDHHRPADPLEEAGGDESEEAARGRAGQRAGHEHDEGGAEHRARTVAVRHPAADRDEDREADEVGGQRELQGDRVLAEAAGDGRQRRGDHRRVGVLHEQGGGDGEGDDAGGAHGSSKPSRTPRVAAEGAQASAIEAG